MNFSAFPRTRVSAGKSAPALRGLAVWPEETCSMRGRPRPRGAAWVLKQEGEGGDPHAFTTWKRQNSRSSGPTLLEPAARGCLPRSRPRPGGRAAGLGSALREPLGAARSRGRTGRAANGHEEPGAGAGAPAVAAGARANPLRLGGTQNSAPAVSGKGIILRTRVCPGWPAPLSVCRRGAGGGRCSPKTG